VLGATDFGFSSSIAGNALTAIRIDTPPAAGTLRLSGNVVASGQLISAADLVAGNLVFSPAANANGIGYASFNFSVKDKYGVFDPTPNALTFNVTPVNDAPVLSGTQSALTAGTEDTSYNITQASLLAGFTDVDGDVLSVTGLTANNGTLSAFNSTTGSWTFTPNANYNGTVSLSYGVSDGTAAPVYATQSFTVAAVNDAPTGAVTIGGTTTQNQTLTAANTLADVDGLGTLNYQWQSSTNGTIWTPIAAATASTFTLTGAQVGTQVRVQVSYTDGQGTAESVASTPTAVIATAINQLTGTAAADTLSGTTGADQMQGLAGNDTYVVNNVGDIVVEALNAGTDLVQSSITYTLTDNVESLTLTGTAAINATGNALANTLTGNAGNNVLDGGAGADTMVGGAGNDTYYVDNAADVTTEAASAGTDTVMSTVTLTLGTNLENLTLLGTAAINATGNTVANVLIGNAGDNILNGGAGKDTMVGGLGNDTYVLDVATDIVTENLNEGVDTVQIGVTYTLGANVENLTLTGTTAVNGTGNALDNVLTGNSGKNTLSGGAGNDTYVVTSGDITTEAVNAGIDTVQSAITWTLATNVENLTLTGTTAVNGTGNTADNVLLGNSAANTLTGGAGNDTLNGGAGADSLVGGVGNDTYWLGRGFGIDTITENDATVGNTDVAQFDTGIAVDQLWFTHTGNNLEVSIIGTTDKFTLTNWYLGNQYHVEQFKTSDGKTLLDSQVQNLVSAMAAFAPPAAGQTTLTGTAATTLTPVIAANWQ
jgi:Ca2+-binding RTX toxin-like protein